MNYIYYDRMQFFNRKSSLTFYLVLANTTLILREYDKVRASNSIVEWNYA